MGSEIKKIRWIEKCTNVINYATDNGSYPRWRKEKTTHLQILRLHEKRNWHCRPTNGILYLQNKEPALNFHGVCVCFGRLQIKCSNSVCFESQTGSKKIEYLQLDQDVNEIANLTKYSKETIDWSNYGFVKWYQSSAAMDKCWETAGPLVTEASQPSIFRSLYSPKSKTRKRCYVCEPNAFGHGYKKMQSQHISFYVQIDAKNLKSLSDAIIFCKLDQNPIAATGAQFLQNSKFLLFSKLCYYLLMSFILL